MCLAAMFLLLPSLFLLCRFVVSGSDDIVVDDEDDDVVIDNDVGVSVVGSSVDDDGAPHRKRIPDLPVVRGGIGAESRSLLLLLLLLLLRCCHCCCRCLFCRFSLPLSSGRVALMALSVPKTTMIYFGRR